MPRKALKCVVDLSVHAVTCPGVFLRERDDVYLSTCILGRYKRTKLLPPVFPLLYHEKFKFERTFLNAVDPAQVADILEDDHVLFELIQLNYSGGKVLARYQAPARDFLYPYPTLTPAYPGADREVLMDRAWDFPGISPKLEFSTKTTIKEWSTKTSGVIRELSASASEDDLSVSRSSRRRKKQKKPKGYEEPTISSRARSPSPYTKRRTSGRNNSKIVEPRPPFVVRNVEDKILEGVPASPPRSPSPRRPSSAPLSSSRKRSSRSLRKVVEPLVQERISSLDDDTDDTAELISSAYRSPRSTSPARLSPRRLYSAPPASPPLSPSSLRSSLRDRFGNQDYFDVIHGRVQRLLSQSELDRLERRLQDDLDLAELRRSLSPRPLSPGRSVVVRLSDDSYWSPKASSWSELSHRQRFEDSMSRVYSGLYKSARSPSALM
ncbi:PREDICTED: spermatogenesis-associated protein 6-like isoform X1 [Branchiostoma belcheri]|uniref:Spermatogenesis-associated protein 6-like isoform X1 n=1 Tax=Branchiostoma belcheri TaxID=7741 RepID=A0A6P5A7V5_BRABE|nr:PREDICTED: spermatogenesis-associated protein 6-like isoform X1 [Branchiostoma belcheri]